MKKVFVVLLSSLIVLNTAMPIIPLPWLNSPLHVAAMQGSRKKIARIIEAGNDVNFVASDDTTPLWVAVLHNNLAAATELIARGANKQALFAGQTVLEYVACGLCEPMKALFATHELPEPVEIELSSDSDSSSGIVIEEVLGGFDEPSQERGAVRNELGSVVAIIFQGNTDSIDVPLYITDNFEFLEQVRLMLFETDEFLRNLTQTNDSTYLASLTESFFGRKLVHIAALHASLEICQALVAAGLDPNALTESYWTPADIAREQGNDEIAAYFESIMLPTRDVGFDTTGMDAATIAAIQAAQAEFVVPDHRIPDSDFYFRPVEQNGGLDFLTADMTDAELAEFIEADERSKRIERGGFQSPPSDAAAYRNNRGSVNAQTLRQRLVLVQATQAEHDDQLRYYALCATEIVSGGIDKLTQLLSLMADPCMVEPLTGETLLHTAVEENNIRAANLLIAHGLSPLVEDKRGRTPLNMAIKTGNTEFVQLFESLPVRADNQSFIERLRGLSTDSPAYIAQVETLTLKACDELTEEPELIEYFQALEALDIDMEIVAKWRSEQEVSALHCVAKFGHYQAAEWLIACGADKTAINSSGQRACDIAAVHEHWALIELLSP